MRGEGSYHLLFDFPNSSYRGTYSVPPLLPHSSANCQLSGPINKSCSDAKVTSDSSTLCSVKNKQSKRFEVKLLQLFTLSKRQTSELPFFRLVCLIGAADCLIASLVGCSFV